MLTSAWLAGADPAPPAAPPAMAPAPAVVANGNGGGGGYAAGGYAGGCGGCGDVCADACGHHRKHRLAGLGGRLKGRKHHNDCCETAAPAAQCCAPAPAPKPVC